MNEFWFAFLIVACFLIAGCFGFALRARNKELATAAKDRRDHERALDFYYAKELAEAQGRALAPHVEDGSQFEDPAAVDERQVRIVQPPRIVDAAS